MDSKVKDYIRRTTEKAWRDYIDAPEGDETQALGAVVCATLLASRVVHNLDRGADRVATAHAIKNEPIPGGVLDTWGHWVQFALAMLAGDIHDGAHLARLSADLRRLRP
jgi:hypothetical protein